MRYRLIVLMAAALLLFLSAAALGDEPNSFQGHWVGTDGHDWSRNSLTVGAGNNHVIYRESGITACEREFDEFVGGSAAGFATIEVIEGVLTLTFTGTLYCNLEEGKTAHPGFEDFKWVVSHNPVDDTVSLDIDTTTLSRSGNH